MIWVRRTADSIRAGSANRCRGERGTSLIIAMGFLGLLSVSVVSMLVLTMANFTTTTTVRGVSGKTYGADGGVDYGIQYLRANASSCASPGSNESLPPIALGGQSVAVSCQTLSGGSGGGGAGAEYSLVLTGYQYGNGSNPDLNRLVDYQGEEDDDDDDGYDSFDVAGKGFNAGGFDIGSSPKLKFTSDLDQYNSPSTYCTSDKAGTNPQVLGTWTCRLPGSFPIPDPNPTIVVPTATAPAKTVLSGCTIYYPGKYTSSNKPTFSSSGKFYFASGVYLFEGAGEVQFEGQVFGGMPGPGETQKITTNTPCANDATANSYRPGSATGSGVVFVLGGSSRLKVASSSSNRVEFFARQPANPSIEPSPGYSVIAPKTSGSGYSAWNDYEAFVTDSRSPTIVVHGKFYAPKSHLETELIGNSDAGYSAEFRGGLVVSSLAFNVCEECGDGALAFAGGGTVAATDRTVVVTATAPGAQPGEVPVVVQAVVLVPADGSAPTVQSWRKV